MTSAFKGEPNRTRKLALKKNINKSPISFFFFLHFPSACFTWLFQQYSYSGKNTHPPRPPPAPPLFRLFSRCINIVCMWGGGRGCGEGRGGLPRTSAPHGTAMLVCSLPIKSRKRLDERISQPVIMNQSVTQRK